MGPSSDDVARAAAALEGIVHRTPVLHSERLDAWAGRRVWCKAEHLQVTGAFKYRGATNAVLRLTDHEARRGVATHSSGNHAGALARAAARRGVRCTVVMPSDAVAVKRDAVRAYGATVVECEPTLDARITTLRAVVEATGAVEVHPYDDDAVIAGAGTAALELLAEVPEIGVVVAPVGGGGLASGTSLAVHGIDPSIRVVGAEPAGADDAARSLATGRIVEQRAPDTIADGLRTSLCERTFTVLSSHLERIVTVTDAEIIEAMRLCWTATKQVVEPSAAVGVAALRHLDTAEPGAVAAGVILSGGNVDLDALPW